MKYFLNSILICIMMLVGIYSSAQVSELDNNTVVPTDYLGWDASTTFDLNIEHRDDGPLINFLTNGNRRMMINSGGAGGVHGYIGMGNALNTAFVPQQRLHLHQGNDNNDNFIRWSNGNIGNMTGLDVGLRGEHTLEYTMWAL